MNAERSYSSSIDWLTIGIWGVLVFMGWTAIYATTYDPLEGFEWGMGTEYGKQMVFIGVSGVLALLILNTEGQFFTQFSFVIYAVFIFLLALVLVAGQEINGAKAWFRLGPLGLQPAEFAKIGTALVLARVVSRLEVRKPALQDQLRMAALLGMPIVLILLQPDVGSILVFTSFVFALYREGWYGNILFAGIIGVLLGVFTVIVYYTNIEYPWVGEASAIWAQLIVLGIVTLLLLAVVRFFYLPRFRKSAYIRFAIIGVGSIVFSLAVSQVMDSDILAPHQKDRIKLTFGIADEQLQMEKGYNMKMAKLAVGSGGAFGKGLTDGPMTRYNFVPEQETDFIFTTIAEEWGFAGCTFMLLLYLFFLLRIMFLAERQRSTFSRVFGYCVASILFIHVLINVGMVIGLAPVIGIPLPFFSYGGSSLMAFSMLVFIFLRLDAERLTVFR
ncbi:MAG: rod shape-determining protein RodA [Flavobacteriales bacterium]